VYASTVGTLAAVRPATGEIAWQVPLGQFPGTEQFPDAAKGGSIALGGPIVTAGGLVFTAGTLEAAIYAFDVRTGQQLWKGALPTSARSTPMTFLGATAVNTWSSRRWPRHVCRPPLEITSSHSRCRRPH